MWIFNNLQVGTFDLHTHTTASDGMLTPTELVLLAKKSGISVLAITDHDTLWGLEEGKEAGKKKGVFIISGVEISTRMANRSIDILGYQIQDELSLHNQLSPYRDHRKTRALEIIQRFTKLGMPLTLSDVEKISGNGVIGRPHIAKAIVAKGYLSTSQEVFDRYLADGKPAAIEKLSLTPEVGIKMIHNAGGKAVLAHPGLIGAPSLVNEIIKMGIDGIEVWHPKHAKQEQDQYLQLARDHQIFITGGSDFHTREQRLGIYT